MVPPDGTDAGPMQGQEQGATPIGQGIALFGGLRDGGRRMTPARRVAA
jgi:hypothetical protein